MEGDIYRLLFNSIILFNYKFTARQTQSGQSLPLSIRVFVRLIFMVWFKAILSVQLSTSKRGKIIKRLVEKLMSSMCPIWEHMQSRLSLETKGRSAHHRRCLWFYPIIEKPLKKCRIRCLLNSDTVNSTLSHALPSLQLFMLVLGDCYQAELFFDGTNTETKARRLNHLSCRCQSSWLRKRRCLV